MKNCTLTLYAFHLARTFDDPPDRATESEAKSFGEELQEKLKNQIGAEIKNELITRLLHDTYFTDLTFFDPKTDLTPDEIDRFNPTAFLPQNINASIGQTIGIYGEVTHKAEATQALADSCVRNFLKNTQYKNDKISGTNTSNLLGIPLFEYFCQSTANTKEPVCHILVLLNYQDENGVNKLSKHYEDIADLLCSYHKIKFVDREAKLSYQDALKVSQEIEKEIKKFVVDVADKNKNLDKFSAMLDKLPLLALKHSAYCGELEGYVNTIEINNLIYKDLLEKLLSAGSQLDSWQKFSDRTRDISLKQIQYWLNYMSPRKELAQQLTASIRGIVEIEQAEIDRKLQQTLQNNEKAEKKRDRELQNTIAIIGVGIGFAGVAATASPYIFEAKPTEKLTIIPVHLQPSFGLNPPHHLTLSLLFSLGAGLVGVAIASFFLRYIQKHEKSAIARTVNFILGNSQAPENKVPPS
ncbi:hypothetical protein [Argonema antarcticum]|uniref:hypothetical protein n=1 Tax=Argonema antarcticum TaxID=2942763 RepID=UPI0020123E47|nr:hypothetical protein [Argonema antarcticum]MCL1473556.1 hypothetical protein [Argonema antarcticum A004/B2]